MKFSTRRTFIQGMAAAAAGLAVGNRLANAAEGIQFKTKLHKAMIVGEIAETEMKALKDAGFDGVETRAIVAPELAAKGRAIAEKAGMRIHSVMRGWAEFNSPDAAKVESSLATTEAALKAAAAYGADTILLVPCRVSGMPMPQPWEFNIEFDQQTGHVIKVVDGDNSKYAAYIDAHNRAIVTSADAVKRLIPIAEREKVVIALENVWNNLWVQPAIYRHFVASFNSPWVKSYFDIGNHVKYVAPQHWIAALGPLIAKCHVKDFKLNADGHGGKFIHPRDGSIDWPAVRRALDAAGYNGWLTVEDTGLPAPEFAKRLDLIIAGK